jgi:hypothetical protein
MILWRRIAARLVMGLLAAVATRAVGAQSISLAVLPLYGDSTSPAPTLSITASPLDPPFGPGLVQLELATDPQFRAPFYIRSTSQLTSQFTVDSLLPEKMRVYFRARLFDQAGTVRAEASTSHPIRSWLALTFPARASNVIFSRRPTFTWDSPAITLPPGPWQYTISIVNTAQNKIEEQRGQLNETSFVPTHDLDACTSYRWSVSARPQNSKGNNAITVQSIGTFVIQAHECPSATISYQNFPNPFGRGTPSRTTCFWFDLAHRTAVSLTLYDIRLHQVKRMVPGALPAVLDSGAYGRESGEEAGCDPRMAWDGTDDRGQSVPQGVYIAVFEAEGRRETKKVFFKGP